jgi:histidinol phosphatase-like PHP family hydrolase
MHVHTWLSLCAKEGATLPRIARAAEAAGLETIGIADHLDLPEWQREWLLLRNRWLLADVETPVQILVGSEVSALGPGVIPLSVETAQALDFVAISCDHYHLEAVEKPTDGSPAGYAAHYLRVLEGALDFPPTDIIAHPWGLTKARLDPDFRLQAMAAYDRAEIRRLLAKAAGREIAFEIKPPMAAACPEFFAEIVELGRAAGVRFSLGSDAHRAEEVGYGGPERMAEAARALEAIGLREDDLFDPMTALRRRDRAEPAGLR